MCDYCDCRSIREIGELSFEHERVLELTHSLRHQPIDAEHHEAIHRDLRALRAALVPHTRREEAGIFAVLAMVDCPPDYRRRFLDDHAHIDEMIETALTDDAVVPELTALVERHVFEEETDLYPALRQVFAPSDWHIVEERVNSAHEPERVAG